MDDSRRAVELTYTFRPASWRPAPLHALRGRVIHSIGPRRQDGRTHIVLTDGTRIIATAAEIVPQP